MVERLGSLGMISHVLFQLLVAILVQDAYGFENMKTHIHI
jgi:hypothetical protein